MANRLFLKKRFFTRAAATLLLATSIAGCAGLQENYKHRKADQAREQAEKIGNSGPLYTHYENCLSDHWGESLGQGTDALQAFDDGLEHCTYELTLLCDFYNVESCPQDALIASRIWYFNFREDYWREHP